MAPDRYPTFQADQSTYPSDALRNNAKGINLDKEALERFKIREICEGWGSYRDAAEWENYRSMFFDGAYITTSWTEGNIDEFIQASKDGFAKSCTFMYIGHRACGSSVDINSELTRAVCKVKTTITCRFTIDGVEMDDESDCRFIFLLEKRENRWGVCFFTVLFDKDKFVAVNPNRTFDVPEEEVDQYPSGYRYLAWAEAKIGLTPKLNMNSHGPEKNILYGKCKDWLEGRVVVPDLTGADIRNWRP